VHASIWKFVGDPDELLAGYDAMLADMPREQMRLHLCLRASDGIVLVDTCPTKEDFDNFVAGAVRAQLREHGLPEPEQLEDFPVHLAIVDGAARR